MNKYILLSLVLFLNFTLLKSETYELNLTKSIEIAKQKSFSILNLKQDFIIAENSLKAVTSRLKTHIDLNFVAPNYSQSVRAFRTDSSISYYSSKQLNYGANLTIRQPLLTDGNIILRSGLTNNDRYSLNERNPVLFSTLSIEQPLTALYGYNSIKSNLKIAKLNHEKSKKGLKREELNLIYDVSSSFYRLISEQKSVEIAKLDYERQTESFEMTKNKYEAGLIKEVDALQMEVDLADSQNKYELSLINFARVQNDFKQLIGLDLVDSVIVSSELDYDVVIVDPEKAVELALANRLEIREQEIQVEQSKMSIKKQKSNGMIQSSLNMSVGKYGTSTQKMDVSLQNSLNNTYTDIMNRTPHYGIEFNVKVPILDFGENKAQVRMAEARLEKTLLAQEKKHRDIEREVRDLVADLNSSLKRLQLLEKSLLIAEKSLDITRQRYADGDVDSQALSLERSRMNSAYKSHLSAYTTYKLKLADIMRKTFYDFSKNEEIL